MFLRFALVLTSIAFAAAATADDVITLRNGTAVRGRIMGMARVELQIATRGEHERVPVAAVHSVRFDGQTDSMAFLMRNGGITDGVVVSVAGGKAKLSDDREITLADVREMFGIAMAVTKPDGLREDIRISEWYIDDKQSYAVVLERLNGNPQMHTVTRSSVKKPVLLTETEPGVQFVAEGDPADKYMRINKDGNLELWLAKRKLATLKRFGVKD